jgi:alpha-N-arabinofuranosidase
MNHVPYVDVAGTFDAESRKISLFVFNRDLSRPREVELIWEDNAPSRVVDSMILTGDDLKAFNSFEAPQRVAPRPFEKPSTSGTRTRLEAPPRSYSVIQWSL